MKSDTEEGEKGDDQVTCHVLPTCPPVGKRWPRLPSRALHETSPSEPISAVALPDPVVGPAYLQLIWAVHFVNKPTGPGGDLIMGPTPPAHRDRQLGRGSEWTPPDSSYIPISLSRSDWVRRSSGMCFGIDSCLICCYLIRWFDRLRCDRFGVSGYAGCGLWVLGFRSIWRRSWREFECPWVSVCLLFESFPVVLFWRGLISTFSVIFVLCIFIFSSLLLFFSCGGIVQVPNPAVEERWGIWGLVEEIGEIFSSVDFVWVM
jgi:hypothetical protein